MMTTTLFDIHPTNESRLGQVDLRDLPFGSVFSDHMFVMDYREGRWETGAIQSYGGMTLSPAAMALHYGQAIFEGMKAFRQPNGDVALFRPDANIARFNVSAERMCMPVCGSGALSRGVGGVGQVGCRLGAFWRGQLPIHPALHVCYGSARGGPAQC